jgi:hypothetical protein
MKNITVKLSAFALGAALLSTAGAADLAAGKVATHAEVSLRASSSYTAGSTLSLQTWDVADTNGSIYLALCVEPGVALNLPLSSYSNTGTYAGFDGKSDVARLYSKYYSTITGTSAEAKNASLSFQLALWELNNDNDSLTSGTLAFKWNGTSWNSNRAENQQVLNDAAAMISYASAETNPIEQQYNFTQYTMAGSQTIVAASPVSAVPEPSTYAMLGLGLALVGFIARRRKQG